MIWVVLKTGTPQFHLLRGLSSMGSNMTTSQKILLWVCKGSRLWNKQVQELEVHCVVIGVIGLIQCHRWVITNSEYALSDFYLRQVSIPLHFSLTIITCHQ